ncbi:MAG TPA: deoxyribose-phosphate aldolase [Terriglobales bacterium]|nr:deoxyribose-phosphate aldolase [Terriglobales bacterium]
MAIEISEAPSVVGSPAQDWKLLASRINSRLLRGDATYAAIEQLCAEATNRGCHCVVVSPAHIGLCASLLSGTRVKIGTLVGFPYGTSTTTTKRYEALDAIRLGARSLELIMNVSALKSGDRVRVETEMRALADLAHDNNASLHVSIEVALLSLEEKILACQLAVTAGSNGVSSGTGFTGISSAPSDVSLMRGVLGDKLDVVASDGIDTLEDVHSMMEAGANRITTNSATAILEAARKR